MSDADRYQTEDHVELARSLWRQAAQLQEQADYPAHLNHSLPQVRQAAAALLCAFPEHASNLLPALAVQIETENEVNIKAGIIQSLSVLLETLPAAERSPYLRPLEDLVGSQENDQVRFSAAVALVRVSGDDTVTEALMMLEWAVDHAQDLFPGQKGREDRLPYVADLIVEEVCAALSYLSVKARIPILMRILDKVSRPAQAHQVAVLLLDSALLGTRRAVSYSGTPDASEDEVFYGTMHPTVADGVEKRIYPQAERALDLDMLTPTQRQALQVVLDCPPVWSIRSNLLQLYGLPQSPADFPQSERTSKG